MTAVERNDLSLPAADVVANIARFRLSATPSTRLSGSAFVQYNGLTEEVVTSLRLRFIDAALSDAYLVIEERRSAQGAFTSARTLALKVTRLLAF